MHIQQLTALDPASRGEDIRIWRPRDLSGVELMTAVNSNRLWRVFYDTYSICVIPPRRNGPEGSEITRFRYRGREDVMQSGTTLLLEPGEVHANIRNARAADFYVFFFDPALLDDATLELATVGQVHWRTVRSESSDVRSPLEQIYAALARGGSTLECETRVAECIRTLIDSCAERRASRGARVHPAIARARDYLHAHALEPVRLDELARVSGLSRFHLVQTFTKTFGIPPHAYQNQLRIASAKKQLRLGVAPSALDAGFFDQSHLNRHFKRTVGVTPSRYAAASTSALPPLL